MSVATCGEDSPDFASLIRATSTSGAPAHDFIGRHRPVKALQGEIADVICLDPRFEQSENALADQDLARLRLVAQPRREVGDATDGGIVEAPVETDLSQRRVTECNADAKTEGMSALAPYVDQRIQANAHVQGHAQGAFGMVETRHGVVEQDQNAVARKALQRSLVAENELAH